MIRTRKEVRMARSIADPFGLERKFGSDVHRLNWGVLLGGQTK